MHLEQVFHFSLISHISVLIKPISNLQQNNINCPANVLNSDKQQITVQHLWKMTLKKKKCIHPLRVWNKPFKKIYAARLSRVFQTANLFFFLLFLLLLNAIWDKLKGKCECCLNCIYSTESVWEKDIICQSILNCCHKQFWLEILNIKNLNKFKSVKINKIKLTLCDLLFYLFWNL